MSLLPRQTARSRAAPFRCPTRRNRAYSRVIRARG
jgi:hypothetical protein